MDMGFQGSIAIGGAFPLATVCRNGSLVPTAPSAAPNYSIYPPGFSSATASGSLGSSDTDSKTRFRTGSVTASAGNGFASGTLYTVVYTYAISSTNYTNTATFLVT